MRLFKAMRGRLLEAGFSNKPIPLVMRGPTHNPGLARESARLALLFTSVLLNETGLRYVERGSQAINSQRYRAYRRQAPQHSQVLDSERFVSQSRVTSLLVSLQTSVQALAMLLQQRPQLRVYTSPRLGLVAHALSHYSAMHSASALKCSGSEVVVLLGARVSPRDWLAFRCTSQPILGLAFSPTSAEVIWGVSTQVRYSLELEFCYLTIVFALFHALHPAKLRLCCY
jgi:hypothetical protein